MVIRRKKTHTGDEEVVISTEGWKDIVIEPDFQIPAEVADPVAYVNREKMHRYVNNHPWRIYYYFVGEKECTVDCKSGAWFIDQRMHRDGASDADLAVAHNRARQFRSYFGMIGEQSKRINGLVRQMDILNARSEELIDEFGRLATVDEMLRKATQEWGYSIGRGIMQAFYQKNLKEIERLRDAYSADYTDLSLTKKRARVDKLSIMVYTYFQKWADDPKIDYSKELRALLEQIKKEVEGDVININVNGQINVDLTIEANKSLYEISKHIPINNLIVAMVAAKRGIDPTKIMAQLTNSHYKSLTGFGRYEPQLKLLHPVDLTYNWNEIERLHRMKDKSVAVEDAQIVESTGSIEGDAQALRVRHKLLEMLNTSKEENEKRKSK